MKQQVEPSIPQVKIETNPAAASLKQAWYLNTARLIHQMCDCFVLNDIAILWDALPAAAYSDTEKGIIVKSSLCTALQKF